MWPQVLHSFVGSCLAQEPLVLSPPHELAVVTSCSQVLSGTRTFGTITTVCAYTPMFLVLWVCLVPIVQSPYHVWLCLHNTTVGGLWKLDRLINNHTYHHVCLCSLPNFEYNTTSPLHQSSQFCTRVLRVLCTHVPRSMRSHRTDRDKSMGSHHLIIGDHQPITTQSGDHPSSF